LNQLTGGIADNSLVTEFLRGLCRGSQEQKNGESGGKKAFHTLFFNDFPGRQYFFIFHYSQQVNSGGQRLDRDDRFFSIYFTMTDFQSIAIAQAIIKL
jgi:hypothetical protein